MKINEEQVKRVYRQATNVIKIIKLVRQGKNANEIVHEVGCNYSVAQYYIKLLTRDFNKNVKHT